MANVDVTFVGQIVRDLVVHIDELPKLGTSGAVRERREVLGGKGANQAVACAQLGLRPGLVGVVGDDETGVELLRQAAADGIALSAVITRPRTADERRMATSPGGHSGRL